MGRPLAFNTVEELEIAVDDYFKSDDAHIVSFVDGSEVKMFAPTMSGLALHLDVDRKTITNYSNKEDYFPTIRKARSKIEAHIEKRLYGNNVTGSLGIQIPVSLSVSPKSEGANACPSTQCISAI